ncbi:hypothetical protein B0H34DRAFT_133344 [Crassisporium funariophilum]|nr:hypothetical protein B0H34DRAFT_133344 [Crassisporium funariophilum]
MSWITAGGRTSYLYTLALIPPLTTHDNASANGSRTRHTLTTNRRQCQHQCQRIENKWRGYGPFTLVAVAIWRRDHSTNNTAEVIGWWVETLCLRVPAGLSAKAVAREEGRAGYLHPLTHIPPLTTHDNASANGSRTRHTLTTNRRQCQHQCQWIENKWRGYGPFTLVAVAIWRRDHSTNNTAEVIGWWVETLCLRVQAGLSAKAVAREEGRAGYLHPLTHIPPLTTHAICITRPVHYNDASANGSRTTNTLTTNTTLHNTTCTLQRTTTVATANASANGSKTANTLMIGKPYVSNLLRIHSSVAHNLPLAFEPPEDVHRHSTAHTSYHSRTRRCNRPHILYLASATTFNTTADTLSTGSTPPPCPSSGRLVRRHWDVSVFEVDSRWV